MIIPFRVGSGGHLHLNGTGGCNGSASPTPPPVWLASGAGAGAGGCCGGALGGTGTASESNGNSPVALATPGGVTSTVYHTQTFGVDATTNILRATLPGWKPSPSAVVEVRFLFDNFPKCALYSGALSGPDSYYASPVQHFGLVAQSWRGNVAVKAE